MNEERNILVFNLFSFFIVPHITPREKAFYFMKQLVSYKFAINKRFAK